MDITRKGIFPLIICIAIPLTVGMVSSWITAGSMKMYAGLNRPAFAPPGILFPIVWTILYILMGISSYLIYVSDEPYRMLALCLYVGQLIFNCIWSPIFFNVKAYGLALVWLLIMWVMIIALIAVSWRISKVASILLMPLVLWTTFAALLNYSVYRMN